MHQVIEVVPGKSIVIEIKVIDNKQPHELDSENKWSLRKIYDKVWMVSGIEPKHRSREQKHLIPRYAFCYIAHKVFGYSQTQVGRFIQMDRTTVFAAANQYRNMLQTDFAPMVALVKELKPHFSVSIDNI